MRKAKRRGIPAYQKLAISWWAMGNKRNSELMWKFIMNWILGAAAVYSESRLNSAKAAAADLIWLSKIALLRQRMPQIQLEIKRESLK